MKKNYVIQLILIEFLAISLSLSGMDNQLTKINFQVPLIQLKELKNRVFLVSDNNNINFILKFQEDPLRGILDAFGAEVGKNKVDMNQVQIFPPHYFQNKLLFSKHNRI